MCGGCGVLLVLLVLYALGRLYGVEVDMARRGGLVERFRGFRRG
jgi:hypothetical protein